MKQNKNKLNQAVNFIEELAWLLESNRGVSLKDIATFIRELSNSKGAYLSNIATSKYASTNPNKQFLVGSLPALLQDNSLFKNKGEVLDFAEDVLNLTPSRAAKRSRIEYIGWIICEVSNLDDTSLESLVSTLSDIVGNEVKIKKMEAAKNEPNFSWNQTIQKLRD